jgi:type IV fimbrial biogenesis protein FimT
MRTSPSTRPGHRPGAGGFSLIELMVTLSVLAILVAIAIPNFIELSVRSNLSGYTNDFIAAVNYARSEAVRRGVPISLCKSSNGTACTGAWSDGWIVFVNTDGDSPADVDVGETILKKYEGATGNYTIGSDTSVANDITYRADGAANNTGMFAICYDGSTTGARAIIVTRLRPRVAFDTNSDRIPNRDDTSNIGSCSAPGS